MGHKKAHKRKATKRHKKRKEESFHWELFFAPYVLFCGSLFLCFLWLEMDDAALEGAGGGLGAIGYAEFAEDVVDVALDGGFADV
jgi:hypothetical protein